MEKFSRRGFTSVALAFLSRPWRLPGSAAAPPADPAAAPSDPRTIVRHYRADAIVLFLGLPLYRRSAVGSGQASVEEADDGARKTLFFAGGSDPKRALGLNRLGWIREVALGSGPSPAETEYFGVLTASPEESLARARKSAAAPESGRSLYSAVNGRHSAGRSRSAVTHFQFAAGADWSDHSLIDEAQSTFHGNVEWRETSWPKSPDQAPPTFLLELATLLQRRAKHASGSYVYNEQEYSLELDAAPQGGSGERLLAVRGQVRNQRTGHQTPFRIWIDDAPGSVVPVRIEFQPRSFLRLTFEAVPG